MERLRYADLKAVIEFVEDAWALAGERPFTVQTLEALGRLIRCDYAAYDELDRVERRELEYVALPEEEDDGDLFWEIVDEHPLCRYHRAYGDYSAMRLSDVITARQLARTRVYNEWFRPYSITGELEVGISRSRARTRNFILDRTDGDFSIRDRAVLELVRPQLARIHEQTALRRELAATGPSEAGRLTGRETEILELVGGGLTNAAIAERLWISPGTVKKHLDNIYAKLGVANRTAAAGRLDPRRGRGPAER